MFKKVILILAVSITAAAIAIFKKPKEECEYYFMDSPKGYKCYFIIKGERKVCCSAEGNSKREAYQKAKKLANDLYKSNSLDAPVQKVKLNGGFENGNIQ